MNTFLSKEERPTRSDLFGNPPGILKDIADHVQRRSFLLQPEHAVAAALSLAATVLGRRYCSEEGLQTNLYLLSVGPDAGGKRRSMSTVEEILEAAGLDHLLTGELADQEALIARVSERKSLLLQFNSLSTLTTMLAMDNLNRRDLGILVNLTELYEAATSRFHPPDHGGEQDSNAGIDHPCVNVHTALTDDGLIRALHASSPARSFLSRFVIVPISQPDDHDRIASENEAPESILEWIRSAVGNEASGAYAPIQVPKTPEAGALFEHFAREIDDHRQTGKDFPWGQALEQADKLSLVAACADELNQLSVTEQHARWAIGFVRHCAELLDNRLAFEASHSGLAGLGAHAVH